MQVSYVQAAWVKTLHGLARWIESVFLLANTYQGSNTCNDGHYGDTKEAQDKVFILQGLEERLKAPNTEYGRT